MTDKSLVRGTSIVAVLTACSRLLGFFRDVVIAMVFGASMVTDAFFVAFRLPNLLRSLVAEGALTSAFVPVFSHTLEENEAKAQATFRSMTGILLLATLFLSSLGILFAEYLILFFAPGFVDSVELFSLASSLARIMFPYIVFVSLIALINGALNSKDIFGAAPLAQIVMNVCLVCGALLAIPVTPMEGIYCLAASVIAGGVLQVTVQIPILKRASLTLRPAPPLFTPETKEILFLMLPAVVGAAAYQLSVLLNTILASLLVTGAVSWLFFADRISQLPVGIFTVSLGSVLLPGLSRAAARSHSELFGNTLLNALRYTSFVMIPLSGYLFCFAEPVVATLFERGSFSALDSYNTALALKAVSFGLWGVGCNYLCMRGFLAHKNTVLPTILGITSVFVTLTIALATMGPIEASGTRLAVLLASLQELLVSVLPENDWGHVGLALSSGIASTLLFPVSLLILGKLKLLNAPLKDFVSSSARLLAITLLLVFFVNYTGLDKPENLFFFVTNSLVSLAIFILLSLLFRVSELQETFALIRRKIRRG